MFRLIIVLTLLYSSWHWVKPDGSIGSVSEVTKMSIIVVFYKNVFDYLTVLISIVCFSYLQKLNQQYSFSVLKNWHHDSCKEVQRFKFFSGGKFHSRPTTAMIVACSVRYDVNQSVISCHHRASHLFSNRSIHSCAVYSFDFVDFSKLFKYQIVNKTCVI